MALDPAPAYVAAAVRPPQTSALLAGWICVGIGLLTAWFFPPAHVFFSVAIVLSVVAMATHQVRAGLLLLASSLAGIGVCAVLFVCGVAALVAGAFHAAARSQPEMTPVVPWSAASARRGPVAVEGVVGGNPAVNRNVPPLTLDEVTTMLSNGKGDDQIIAATTGRPLPHPLGASEITSLRAYGACERLINNLQRRPVSGYGQRPTVYVAPEVTACFTPPITAYVAPPTAVPALPVTRLPATAAPPPPPVDHATVDRQVQNLKSQIDALDEQVRRIRENPKDSQYWWHYSSSQYNGIDQAKLDAYLKELDRQRNDLRRQKWALEGR